MKSQNNSSGAQIKKNCVISSKSSRRPVNEPITSKQFLNADFDWLSKRKFFKEITNLVSSAFLLRGWEGPGLMR